MRLTRTKLQISALLTVLCLASPLRAQDDPIRVATDDVRVPVTVMDKDGRYVDGLKKSDFTLVEAGVAQEIAFFGPTDTPFTVMLLADVSGSMEPFMAQLGRAMDVLISQLRPEDTIVVATFSDWAKIDVRVDPTKKKDYQGPKPPQKQGKGAPKWPNWTMTSDAVDEAIKYMKKIEGRRAIILFGDGDFSGRYATPATNLRDAEEQESIFYTIRYGEYPPACVVNDHQNVKSVSGSESQGSTGIISNQDLNEMGTHCYVRKNEIPKLIKLVNAHMFGLAEKTGGRGYQIKDIANLAETFTDIVAELGRTYTLGYEPKTLPKEGERRKITVKVNIPNVAVRSRNEVVFKKK